MITLKMKNQPTWSPDQSVDKIANIIGGFSDGTGHHFRTPVGRKGNVYCEKDADGLWQWVIR